MWHDPTFDNKTMASLERERRSTAGKRMTLLTGNAIDEDEAFWGHDTWADENDSGNESFHSSDEESEVKKDVFDSDFDESESDREEEERAAGDAKEKELRKEERSERMHRKPKIARDARAKLGAPRRVAATELNAGLVLNNPDNTTVTNLPSIVQSSEPLAHAKHKPPPSPTNRRITRQSDHTSSMRSLRSDALAAAANPKRTGTQAVASKKQKREIFTQEELLLEAARETEPENIRWLLARKRIRDQSESEDKEHRVDTSSGKVIERYTSRRGYLNTITFPEMDHVPDIFTRYDEPVRPDPTYCVITGHRARYRDPLTGLGYYDMASFQALREKHKEGHNLNASDRESNATIKSAIKSHVNGNKESQHSINGDNATCTGTSLIKDKNANSASPTDEATTDIQIVNGANNSTIQNMTHTRVRYPDTVEHNRHDPESHTSVGSPMRVDPVTDGTLSSPTKSLRGAGTADAAPTTPIRSQRKLSDLSSSRQTLEESPQITFRRQSPRQRKPSSRIMESSEVGGLRMPIRNPPSLVNDKDDSNISLLNNPK